MSEKQACPVETYNWRPSDAQWERAYRALQDIEALCETEQMDNWERKKIRAHILKLATEGLKA